METYEVTYGESFDFKVEIDEPEATLVTLNVGKLGELPVISVSASIEDGIAYIQGTRDDTRVPLDTYQYQLTVEFDDPTKAYKYPSKKECGENGLPRFIVSEALDETEVS